MRKFIVFDFQNFMNLILITITFNYNYSRKHIYSTLIKHFDECFGRNLINSVFLELGVGTILMSDFKRM
jgi:hypothetical protein